MAKPSPAHAPPRAYYTDATAQTFREALVALEKTLPDHHAALAALVDAGCFDEVDAIVALLEAGVK